MPTALIDSSILLDLVLCFQQKHRRNRAIASSAGAALECLLFYDHIVVERESSFALLSQTVATRYLEYYCDDVDAAVGQLAALLELCTPLDTGTVSRAECYEWSLDYLERYLEVIPNPDDLRAYEMYDFLPYHLGEDPTPIECQLNTTSASELSELRTASARDFADVIARLEIILSERRHPTRAAWALPLLRFVYLETMQQAVGMHMAPHATKSTIGFGREAQTVRSRRLLDYCKPEVRAQFANRIHSSFGEDSLALVVPNIAAAIAAGCRDWRHLIDMVYQLRSHSHFRTLRAAMTAAISNDKRPDMREYGDICREIDRYFNLPASRRKIILSLPFFRLERAPELDGSPTDNRPATEDALVLLHQTSAF